MSQLILPSRRELLRLAAMGAVVVPASGCATLWDLLGRFIKAPDLIIRKMNVTDMTLTSISVKFLADLINPNKIGFRLFGLDYLLRLEGNELARGSAPKGIDLRAGARAKTELDFTFDVGKTASAILSVLKKDAVNYEIEAVGKFLSAGKDGVNVPASFKGKMPMPDLPATSIKSFSPTSVGASGVRFRVETSLKNQNDFEIPIDGFKFGVKLNNKTVVSNKSAGGLRIAPKKTGVVPIDFTVGLVELGLSLAEIATGARVNYELTSELRSGKLVMPFSHKGNVNVRS